MHLQLLESWHISHLRATLSTAWNIKPSETWWYGYGEHMKSTSEGGLHHAVRAGHSGTSRLWLAARRKKHRLLRWDKAVQYPKICSVRPDRRANPPTGYLPSWPSLRPHVAVISWRTRFKWEQGCIQFAYRGRHGLSWTEVTLETCRAAPAVKTKFNTMERFRCRLSK